MATQTQIEALQQQIDAAVTARTNAATTAAAAAKVDHTHASLQHRMDFITGGNHSLESDLANAAAHRNSLSLPELNRLHTLEKEVVPHAGRHFGSLNAAQQRNMVEYLGHDHGLASVKATIGQVPANTRLARKTFNVAGVAGQFAQHTDGTVIHHVDKKTFNVIAKGAEVEKHVADAGKQVANSELGRIARARKAVFGSKPMKAAGKWGLIVGGTAAAIGGVYWLTQRGKTEYKASDHMYDRLPDAALPQVMQPQDLMMPQQPDTMMGMAPTPGEHANRVMMGRGGQQMSGPVNPPQNVAEAETMGAIPAR